MTVLVYGLTHVCYKLLDLHRDKQAWKNFHLKAAAMIASSFSEVLYLDSDNFPLRDPEYLFDAPPYREGGSVLFWPDYNKDHRRWPFLQFYQVCLTPKNS